MSKLLEQFKAARRAAVPIIAIETVDQQNTIRAIGKATNGSALIQWDAIRGLTPLNDNAQSIISDLADGQDPAMFTNPSEMLSRILTVPEKTVIFMSNAHRFIAGMNGSEFVTQGIANCREVFKGNGATLVLLGPGFNIPAELQQDVMMLTEPLPNEDEIQGIVQSICKDAGIDTVPESYSQIVDCLIGLSGFAAEQTLSTCVYKDKEDGKVKIDRSNLWERKCKAIEQTKGLGIYRGKEKFADLGGCDNAKDYITRLLEHYRCVVFLDEIEKAFAGSSGDTSGVSQDQLGAILSFMQDKEVDGMIFIGPPGAAKSALAKAAGNEGNIPTVSFDLGGMKSSLVGESGRNTREALKVIEAISLGKALFIATCNKISSLPPELRRRFTMGTFFFDLPTKAERDKIWAIYFKKYALKKQEMPNDEGWTGAEIRQCAKLADKLRLSLIEAAAYIVPVAKSATDQIKTLREMASGKFIDAGKKGVYTAPPVVTTERRMINNAN